MWVLKEELITKSIYLEKQFSFAKFSVGELFLILQIIKSLFASDFNQSRQIYRVGNWNYNSNNHILFKLYRIEVGKGHISICKTWKGDNSNKRTFEMVMDSNQSKKDSFFLPCFTLWGDSNWYEKFWELVGRLALQRTKFRVWNMVMMLWSFRFHSVDEFKLWQKHMEIWKNLLKFLFFLFGG